MLLKINIRNEQIKFYLSQILIFGLKDKKLILFNFLFILKGIKNLKNI